MKLYVNAQQGRSLPFLVRPGDVMHWTYYDQVDIK